MDRTSRFLFLIAVLIFLTANAGLTQELQLDELEELPEEELIETRDIDRAQLEFQFGYQAYHRDANLPEARSRFENALRADTKHYQAMYVLGNVYYALGLNEKAIEVWEEGLMASGHMQRWFQREINSHYLRYNPPQPGFIKQWNYQGLIDGSVADRRRHVNPSALMFLPNGNFVSASLKMGKVVEFTTGGRMANSWSGFSRPVDFAHHDRLGLLVAERGADKISRITPAGQKEDFATEGLQAPVKIINAAGKLFVFNSGPQELVRFSITGDTLATIWRAHSLSRITDLAVDSENRFWLFDERRNSLHVIDAHGEIIEEINVDPRLGIEKLWWHEDRLLIAARPGLVVFDPQTGEYEFLYENGDVISGADISALDFYSDRMIISLFEESALLIYRQLDPPRPDILVQDRRTVFDNYPIIRKNIIVSDPLRSGRYRALTDHSLGIEVEDITALPSLLRPARTVRTPGWILIIDNRLDSEQTWLEMRSFLEELITVAPDDANGSIWKLEGDPIVSGYTSSKTRLRNALHGMFPSTASVDESDTAVIYYLQRALDNAFSRRGPTGVVLVSQNISGHEDEMRVIARRTLNNRVPLVLLNPSIEELGPDHPFTTEGQVEYMNFGNMDPERAWEFYDSSLEHHYTTIFRSPFPRLQSGEWYRYQFNFHYLNLIMRFECGYLLP